MALTFTQADLDNLKEALVSGALRVRIGDREVMYRSQAELLKVIELVQNSLSAPSTDDSPSIVQASFSKNLKD